MDEFVETSNLPVIINILILLVGTVLFFAGFIFFTLFFPIILTEKCMGGPILSGKELENYVRKKYAYKIPTTEGQTEQKQAKLQTEMNVSNNEEEK